MRESREEGEEEKSEVEGRGGRSLSCLFHRFRIMILTLSLDMPSQISRCQGMLFPCVVRKKLKCVLCV